jgi:hypothetical protein
MSFIKIHNCRCDYGAGKRIASVSPDERCREVKLGLLVRGVYLQAGFGAVLEYIPRCPKFVVVSHLPR